MIGKSTNIELILTSLDGVKRAEATPFLYTKIKARLAQSGKRQSKQNFFDGLVQLITRPAVGSIFFLTILLANGIVLRTFTMSSPAQPENLTEETLTRYFIEDFYYDTPESDYNYLLTRQ